MIIKKILPILLTGILFFGIGMAAASGADTTPGSEADPLVSKSYVDGKTVYVPLQLQPGQSLIGDEGTEIILRSGEGTAIEFPESGEGVPQLALLSAAAEAIPDLEVRAIVDCCQPLSDAPYFSCQ